MIAYIDRLKGKDLRGEIALVRTGFDIKNGENVFRLTKSIPTIQFLRRRGATIVLVSHRGRPKKKERILSMKHFAPILSRILKTKVIFIPHFRFANIKKQICMAPQGSVFLLENLRFHPGEQTNDASLAKQLASLGTFFVNEAFSVSHRPVASLVAITRYLPSYGGLLLQEEIKNLSRISREQKRPFIVVLGGAKISDKIGLIRHFIKRADHILIGGAVANMFLALYGVPLQNSYIEKNSLQIADELLRHYGKKIIIPLDWKRDREGAIKDIGPRTTKLFHSFARNARTIMWNGPLGYTESPQFRKGTLDFIRSVARSNAFSVVGGGETAEFIAAHRLQKKISLVSTGGGAMLEYLGGKKLPALQALETSYVKTKHHRFISR